MVCWLAEKFWRELTQLDWKNLELRRAEFWFEIQPPMPFTNQMHITAVNTKNMKAIKFIISHFLETASWLSPVAKKN